MCVIRKKASLLETRNFSNLLLLGLGPGKVSDILAAVKDRDLWKDMIANAYKQGTTWMQEIVYLVMNNADTGKALQTTIDKRVPFFEYGDPGFKAISAMPSPRFIKSHLALSVLPDQMETKKPKIIYMHRNPKDIVVSYYSFFVKFLVGKKFTGTFEDFCRLFTEDKVHFGPWWKHVTEAWASRHKDNFLLLCYEDLQAVMSPVVADPDWCVLVVW
ncbi:sulfotransferase [Plakobranchus ocellatus]|uniref:Sulfotransferase n=1 Tax=Plakobranchus ocellatus TaxID=259542 RepID=A0AAV4DFT4_9GAST|nr:sulfotransferase [Plakobranchus ocellatus]